MKIKDISELGLAVIVAVATLVGSLVSSVVDKIFIDPNVEVDANVRIIETAISVLNRPVRLDEYGGVDKATAALRRWAANTLNAAAIVKLDDESMEYLISGYGITPLDFENLNLREEIASIKLKVEFEEFKRMIENLEFEKNTKPQKNFVESDSMNATSK